MNKNILRDELTYGKSVLTYESINHNLWKKIKQEKKDHLIYHYILQRSKTADIIYPLKSILYIAL